MPTARRSPRPPSATPPPPEPRPGTDASPGDEVLKAPGLWELALEARAPWELGAWLAFRPLLRRVPGGDGHPVVVLPGLAVSDFSTWPLRHFLSESGYQPHPWRQGFNLGPREGVLSACLQQIRSLSYQTGQRVSLVGWSLGGIYARELAKEVPDLVRCVITLGSPFAGHPRATNAWRLFEWVSGQSAQDEAVIDLLRQPPPVPTTSIFSRSDGVVAWPCSLNPSGPRLENIRIPASHLGMPVHPLTMLAVADRLRQDPSDWRPFRPEGLVRWLYPTDPGSHR